MAGIHELDDGHAILSSKLYLHDALGRWSVPIEAAADGLDLRLSSRGLLLAFQGLFDGLIHVGRLEFGTGAP